MASPTAKVKPLLAENSPKRVCHPTRKLEPAPHTIRAINLADALKRPHKSHSRNVAHNSLIPPSDSRNPQAAAAQRMDHRATMRATRDRFPPGGYSSRPPRLPALPSQANPPSPVNEYRKIPGLTADHRRLRLLPSTTTGGIIDG